MIVVMLMLNLPRAFTLVVLVTPAIPGSYVYNMYIQDQPKYVVVIYNYIYRFYIFFLANLRDRGSHEFYSPINLIYLLSFLWLIWKNFLLHTCSWIIFICNMYKMEGGGPSKKNPKIVSFPSMSLVQEWTRDNLLIVVLRRWVIPIIILVIYRF